MRAWGLMWARGLGAEVGRAVPTTPYLCRDPGRGA
jgi:hypothetical protein